MTLDSVGLEAAAKVLAFRDLAADPDWHGVYEEEWAAQPEEYREAWRESVREVLAPYLAAVVPVTPTTENHDTVEWLRSTSREFASHGFRSCDVSLLDAERVARAERERGFAAGRVAATPDPPSDRNIARMFHEVYERLAPTFGYRTREESAVPWERVPARNRDLMTATVGEVRAHLAAASPDERLREALREIVAAFPPTPDREMDEEEVDQWYADHGDWFQRLRALTAADREKPGYYDHDHAADAPPVPDPETSS